MPFYKTLAEIFHNCSVTEALLTLASYSCENLRLSLAFRRSRWSARSRIGIGGWLAIPVNQMDWRSVASLARGNHPSTSEQWIIREAACVFNRGNGRVELVRLVCSLKAVAMLIKRKWTQKPMRSHRAHLPHWDSPYWERRKLFTQKAAMDR